jgi:DnaJ-class molecular chaperone
VERVNLYETLGVGRRDSADLVRCAYRDLARLSHATIEAVPRFVREMEVAVAVLSDGARRTHYDDVVRADSGAEAEMDEPAETHLDLLRDFSGGPPSREEVWSLFRSNFAPGAEHKSGHVHVLELHIAIGDRVPGAAGVLAVAVPLFHACADCHGTGSIDWVACHACDGSGVAEQRSQVRVPMSARESTISLGELGVRTPILRLHVVTALA